MKIFLFTKKHLFTFFVITFILLLIILSSKNITIISKNIELFLSSVLPALFPFILFTECLINYNLYNNFSNTLLKCISKIFKISNNASTVIIFGYLLGYPNAAKHAIKLYNNKLISKNEFNFLMTFTNNANISYILITIGSIMLKNINFGIILLLSHFLSSLIIGLLVSNNYSNSNIIQHNNIFLNTKKTHLSVFDNFKLSIKNTIITLSYILSYMITFNLIPNILFNVFNFIKFPDILKSLITSLFEITSGINMINALDINLTLKLCLISFSISFSSIMILFQIYTYIYTSNYKFKYLLKWKFIQGILSSILTYILISLNFFI